MEERGTLTDNEMNALGDAAGFLPRKLLKKYSGVKTERADSFCSCLRGLVVDMDDIDTDRYRPSTEHDHAYAFSSIDDYSARWLDMRNRGGLFCVSNEYFELFVTMENLFGVSFKNGLRLHQRTVVEMQKLFKLSSPTSCCNNSGPRSRPAWPIKTVQYIC